MKMRSVIVGLLGAALVVGNAHASSVIDSITGTNPAGADGMFDGATMIGQSFSYNYSATPDFGLVANLLLQSTDSGSTGSVMVYLVADNGGGGSNGTAGSLTYLPVSGGSAFASLTNEVLVGSISDSAISDSPTNASIYISASAVAAIASETQNNEYWLVLDFGDSAAGWSYNDAAPIGTGTDGQAWFNEYNNQAVVFPVGMDNGPYQVAIDAPEPATLAVLGGALTGLGILRRRRAKKI